VLLWADAPIPTWVTSCPKYRNSFSFSLWILRKTSDRLLFALRPEGIVALHPNVNAQYSSKFHPQPQVGCKCTGIEVELRRILEFEVKILAIAGEL
jgi:hypothetical protein